MRSERGPLPGGRGRGAVRAAAAATGLVLLLGACTGDDGGDDEGPGAPEATRAAEPLTTTSRLGELSGRLPVPRRKQVLARVVDTVDGWLDAAYVGGDYPRSDFGRAWPGFTPDARARARRDAALTSNARVGEQVETVTATRRRVVVDVLSVGGRPVGATARVELRLRLEGEVDRTDAVRGRLLLSPSGKRWTVFGYDLTRARVVPGGKSGGKAGGKGGGKAGGKNGRAGKGER